MAVTDAPSAPSAHAAKPAFGPAYAFLVANAFVIGALALIASLVLDRPIADPEGSFLGPSWVRLPVLCLAAIVTDLLPRALWQGRLNPARTLDAVRHRLRTHWTSSRLQLVVVGISAFYVIYVSYRNLKSVLPLVRDVKYDRELRVLDRLLLLGNDPATLLQDLLGTDVTAHVLSAVYLAYIPLVAILVTVWLVWSNNINYGWWFVTAQGIAWTLGAASYYLLPTLGPGLAYAWLTSDLTPNGTSDLMDSLVYSRQGFLWSGGEYQGVAGFASLHTAISLVWALMARHTIRNRTIRVLLWINFGLTVVATLYFGWHYIADDVAGVIIAVVAVRVGAWATGHRGSGFDMPGRPWSRSRAAGSALLDEAPPIAR